jgi:hypothetical protein
MDFRSKLVVLRTKYSTFREEKFKSGPRHREINDTALYQFLFSYTQYSESTVIAKKSRLPRTERFWRL